MTEFDGELPDPDAPTADHVAAASREAESSDDADKVLVLEWDGDEWDIPTEPTIDYGTAIDALNDSLSSPKANIAVLTSLLGEEQVVSMGFDGSSSLRDLMRITGEFIELANVAWGVPNFKKSARRSGRTTKR